MTEKRGPGRPPLEDSGGETGVKSFRCPDDTWARAQAVAKRRGEVLSDVLRAEVARYATEMGQHVCDPERSTQWDATMQVVIRADRPVTVQRLRELVEAAGEIDINIVLRHYDGREELTVTAGSVIPESVSPFDDSV